MSNDNKITANSDSNNIDVNNKYELFAWSIQFGVNIKDLKYAVKKVGTNSVDVDRFLNRKDYHYS